MLARSSGATCSNECGDIRGAGMASRVAVMCFMFACLLFVLFPVFVISRSPALQVSFHVRAERAGGVKGFTANELDEH